MYNIYRLFFCGCFAADKAQQIKNKTIKKKKKMLLSMFLKLNILKLFPLKVSQGLLKEYRALEYSSNKKRT